MGKPAWRNLLLFLAYPLASWAVIGFADVIWQPVAGLRFALALLLPKRWWLPLWLWGELGFHALDLIRDGYWHATWSAPPTIWLLSFLILSAAPFLLRLRGPVKTASTPDWLWLLGAMLFCALANATRLALLPDPWASGIPVTRLFPEVLLGDINGMLMTVPLVLALAQPRELARKWPRWHRELPLALFAQCVLALLLRNVQGNLGFFLVAVLLLPTAAWLAFRGGWRGASCGLSAASVLIAVLGNAQGDFAATREVQVLMVVAGTILLLLGVAVDSLRIRERELAQRNRELGELAQRLRDTARRNQTQADDLRRWITGEVHDEVGQNLTALQLQIRLAENDSGQLQLFTPMREIVGHMRHSVSALLNQLRPAGIDEFGLRRTLAEGSVAELLRLAGVRYRLFIDGDAGALDALPDEAQVSLYRIVQETATNALRHANPTRFSVHLRMDRVGGQVHVILRCADDGSGIDQGQCRTGGLGLHGINDRVASFGGRLRIKSDERGTRILAVIAFS
jgi:two-component system sensor histidine kinase UhpB